MSTEKSKLIKKNKKLFELKTEGVGIVDIFNTVHNCRVCKGCHISHLFCDNCIECYPNSKDANLKHCPKCDTKLVIQNN